MSSINWRHVYSDAMRFIPLAAKHMLEKCKICSSRLYHENMRLPFGQRDVVDYTMLDPNIHCGCWFHNQCAFEQNTLILPINENECRFCGLKLHIDYILYINMIIRNMIQELERLYTFYAPSMYPTNNPDSEILSDAETEIIYPSDLSDAETELIINQVELAF
jgi:hypothetical protein